MARYYDNLLGFSDLKYEAGNLYGRLNGGQYVLIPTQGPPGTDGTDGEDGASAYVYHAFASDSAGTGFTLVDDGTLAWTSWITTTTPITSPTISDFPIWIKRKGVDGVDGQDGEDGRDAYVYVGWASDSSGSNFSMIPSSSLPYRAELHTDHVIASPSLADFTGIPFVNIGGAGTTYTFRSPLSVNSQNVVSIDLTEYLPKDNPTATGTLSVPKLINGAISGRNACIASGGFAHAEGLSTTASGSHSHAEGFSSTASGVCSHAEGYGTTASGISSHAEGYATTAQGDYQHVEGRLNVPNTEDIMQIGCGDVLHGIRKNAFAIDEDGDTQIYNDLYVKGEKYSRGGLPIGAIFAYPLSVPPEGAYLLNGQTITNCETLYPDFWDWIEDHITGWQTKEKWVPWVQPVLTGNGTMGVDDFAVSATSHYSDQDAWKAFDSNENTFFTTATSIAAPPQSIILYTKEAIKISSIDIKNISSTANRTCSTYQIYGSNNGSDWIALTEILTNSVVAAGEKWTMQVDSENTYNYHKIEFLSYVAGYVQFSECSIHATKFIRSWQESTGSIRAFNSNTEYENEVLEYGQCGAFVISGSNVRLPMLNGFIQGVGNGTGTGTTIGAGLPNITGSVGWGDDIASTKSEGAFYAPNTNNRFGSGAATDNNNDPILFDASLSNPIYGNSDTVQPPAIKYSYCIQVFNAATELSQQESAQIATSLQGKADANLGNITNTYDYVRRYHIESDGSWVRIWKSGWVEQGGTTSWNNVASFKTITLPIEMANTRYKTLVTTINSTCTGTGQIRHTCNVQSKTTTSFVTYTDTNLPNKDWYACGQGDPTSIEDYIESL